MNYTKIVIKNRKDGTMEVRYEGNHTDEMGLWQSSGSLYDVHEVEGYLILMSPFKLKPIGVCKSFNEFFKRLVQTFKGVPVSDERALATIKRKKNG